MNRNLKIFRIGHRLPRKQGVITIASILIPETGRIFFGASFCHPKEKVYNKQMGIDLALAELAVRTSNNNWLEVTGTISHANVLSTILVEMLVNSEIPKWSTSVILEQLRYPTGLKRFPVDKQTSTKQFGIAKVVVNSEFAKSQLLMAIDYIENTHSLDENFVAIRTLLDLGCTPELIVVEK